MKREPSSSIRAIAIITAGDDLRHHGVFSTKNKVHSGKKNGGLWYTYGEEHGIEVPDSTTKLCFAVLLVNSAKDLSEETMLDIADKLSRSVPVKMQSAGEHGGCRA